MNYLLFIILFLLVSCQQTIEIPVKANARLFMECFCHNGADTTFVNLSVAVPANDLDYPKDLNNIDINFSINGQKAEMQFLKREGDIYIHYTLAPIHIGDEIAVTVNADDYPTLLANGKIPPLPTNVDMSRDGSQYIFRANRDNSTNEKCYYGVRIYGNQHEEHISSYREDVVRDVPIIFTRYDAMSSIKSSFNDMINKKYFEQVEMDGKYVLVFEDDGSDDFEMKVVVQSYYDQGWTSGDNSYSKRYQYKVELFRLDEVSYKWCNPQYNHTLVGMGFLPPFASYSNIVGGYGVLACMSCIESEWLPNLCVR